MSFWETPYLPLPELNVNTYSNCKMLVEGLRGAGGAGGAGGLKSDCGITIWHNNASLLIVLLISDFYDK